MKMRCLKERQANFLQGGRGVGGIVHDQVVIGLL